MNLEELKKFRSAVSKLIALHRASLEGAAGKVGPKGWTNRAKARDNQANYVQEMACKLFHLVSAPVVEPVPTIKKSNYQRFVDSASGRQLLKNHTVEEYGTWQVVSSFGVRLGIYEGSLGTVINQVVENPLFWHDLNIPGEIEKVNIKRL